VEAVSKVLFPDNLQINIFTTEDTENHYDTGNIFNINNIRHCDDSVELCYSLWLNPFWTTSFTFETFPTWMVKYQLYASLISFPGSASFILSCHSGESQVPRAVCVSRYFSGIGCVPSTTLTPYFSSIKLLK